MLSRCQKAAESIGATLVDMRFIKPLDEEMLKKLAKSHKYFVTVEDNAVAGGAGSAVNEFLAKAEIKVNIKNLGLPDKFLAHGTRDEILADAGLDENSVTESIFNFLRKK